MKKINFFCTITKAIAFISQQLEAAFEYYENPFCELEVYSQYLGCQSLKASSAAVLCLCDMSQLQTLILSSRRNTGE